MKTLARVRRVRDGRASLACESAATGCGACAGGMGCGLRWLGSSGAAATLEVPALRPDGTRLDTGDAVLVEVRDGELLRAAVAAYLVPLAGLLGGPLLARFLAGGHEILAVAAAAAGLAVGWGASRRWLRRSPPRYVLSRVPRS